jgi:hypothetical protein
MNKGLAVSDDGTTLAVSNNNTHAVTLYETHTCSEIGSFGEKGQGPGQFHFPGHLCFANDDRHLLVTDTENHRFQEVTRRGDFVRFIVVGDVGVACGIAVKDGLILVSYWGKPEALTLIEYTSGQVVKSFGGESVLLFNRGCCFAPGSGPHCFVANSGGNNVLEYSGDGRFVRAFGDRSVLKHPVAVCTSHVASGTYDIFVGGQSCNEIAVFRHTPDGECTFVKHFGGKDLLTWVSAIAVSDGRLFVLDCASDRIQVFE